MKVIAHARCLHLLRSAVSTYSNGKISRIPAVHRLAEDSNFPRDHFHSTQTSVLFITRQKHLTNIHSLRQLPACYVCCIFESS